jgi:hypothetical protein
LVAGSGCGQLLAEGNRDVLGGCAVCLLASSNRHILCSRRGTARFFCLLQKQYSASCESCCQSFVALLSAAGTLVGNHHILRSTRSTAFFFLRAKGAAICKSNFNLRLGEGPNCLLAERGCDRLLAKSNPDVMGSTGAAVIFARCESNCDLLLAECDCNPRKATATICSEWSNRPVMCSARATAIYSVRCKGRLQSFTAESSCDRLQRATTIFCAQQEQLRFLCSLQE